MYSYNPYYQQNPFAQMQQNYIPQSSITRQDIIKVNGENGAKAYQMPPNSSALLLDETMSVVWLKQTDGAGYPSLTAYSIPPYVPEEPVNTSHLERRIKRLEDMMYERESNTSNAEQSAEQ